MRLPRTSARGAAGHLKLLTAVDLYAPRGLQFRGQLLSPGAPFAISDLPRPAVLVECAGSVRVRPGRSRSAFEHLWILWRFDFSRERWLEVVRMTATDAGWTDHVAPIAWKLLHPGAEDPAEERAAPAVERIAAFIGRELEEISRDVRGYVLAALDQYLANQIVSSVAELSVRPMASGDGARIYPRIGAHPGADPGVLRPPLRI